MSNHHVSGHCQTPVKISNLVTQVQFTFIPTAARLRWSNPTSVPGSNGLQPVACLQLTIKILSISSEDYLFVTLAYGDTLAWYKTMLKFKLYGLVHLSKFSLFSLNQYWSLWQQLFPCLPELQSLTTCLRCTRNNVGSRLLPACELAIRTTPQEVFANNHCRSQLYFDTCLLICRSAISLYCLLGTH